ncbi:MAG: hypothetical protein JJE07_09145 [Flavobacteriaceae bacterium]|nr:hypothetical protein [Flavobacteriaceae bacterium]
MKRGRTYRFEEIAGHAEQTGYDLTEYGNKAPGGGIVILQQFIGKNPGRTISIIFVLTGLNNYGNVYECVYTNEPMRIIDD